MLKPPNPEMRDFVRTYLNDTVEHWALKYLEPAMSGDPYAAECLVGLAGNCKRGVIALMLYLADIPKVAYRAALVNVWNHDHRYLLAELGYNRDPLWMVRLKLYQLFKHGDFQLPAELPETVTVWRGTSALNRQKAANGFSWTTDRDTACWFAMRFAENNGKPLVLKAEVPRKQVLLYTEERGEHEIVIADQLRTKIDGTPADWSEGFSRRVTKKETAFRRMLERHSTATA